MVDSEESQLSTAEETSNKATFKRFHEAANTGDVELIAKTIDEIVAPHAVIRTPLPIDAAGPELLKQVWTMLLRVYPDIHLTVEDVIAEGDKVVARNTVSGTHQGEFMGFARPESPLRTTRSSSSDSPTVVWSRRGVSSTSTRR